jgi:hypothetical protein
VTSKCAAFTAGGTSAMGIGSTITMMCASQCVPAPPAGDGGTSDAGH